MTAFWEARNLTTAAIASVFQMYTFTEDLPVCASIAVRLRKWQHALPTRAPCPQVVTSTEEQSSADEATLTPVRDVFALGDCCSPPGAPLPALAQVLHSYQTPVLILFCP